MIAETYGKLSSSGSNLHDRLEDNLTGNVFGSLRYIPFDKAMKPIIANAIYPRSIADTINEVQANFWNNNIKFWPYDVEGELDVLMEFDNVIIGIEVKYLSSLSSNDNIDYSESSEDEFIEYNKELSSHQLSREARIISKRAGKKKKILIFIAKNPSCREIYEDTINKDLIVKDVELGYVTWQTFFSELSKLKLDNEFYNLIIDDLIKLLKRKRLNQFKDMTVEDEAWVDSSSYFEFDYKLNNILNFDISTNVRGDLYYEFQ